MNETDIRYDVTVAICTRNRAHLLVNTLQSLSGLKLPPSLRWELIVIDNGSTDDTAAVCASFKDRLPLRVLREDTPGLSNARNRALRVAGGDYIVFTDDDVRVEPEWLVGFFDTANRWPTTAAFGGPIDPDFPFPPDADLAAAFPVYAAGFCGVDHKRSDGPLPNDLFVWGANMAYRRAAIQGMTFSPTLGPTPTSLVCGDDLDFLNRLRAAGGQIVWCPSMRVKHYVDPRRMTLRYLIDFHIAKGEERVRVYGAPYQRSPKLLGAPRWLVRKAIEEWLRYALARSLFKRRDAFKHLAQYCEYRGLAAGHKKVAASTDHRSSGHPATSVAA